MNTIIRFSCLLVLFLGTFSANSQELDTRQAPLPCVDKTFSVVAHVVLDSLGEPNITEMEITDALEDANEAFAPICIRFEICEFRNIANFQYDDLDRQTTEWEELQVKYHIEFGHYFSLLHTFEGDREELVNGSYEQYLKMANTYLNAPEKMW